MTYTVEYDSVESMIVINITGETGLSELREIAAAIMRVAKQKNCFCILTDLRKAKLEVSIMEIYALPGDIAEIATNQDLKIYTAKRAFVTTKEQDILNFYETVSRNRSHNTRLFYDIKEAKTWLLEK